VTLSQLRYVVAVDTHRHFGRAADHCFVSQPTLSAQIHKLEDELGLQLFDRSRKPVLPTDAGAAVIAQARIVLRESERIPELVRESRGEVAGELRLGVIPTLAPYLLPLVTGPFAERYPQVTVVVRELLTEGILDHLATDRLDAGLIATPENRPGMVVRPLFTEPFVAYVGEGHALAAADAVAPDALSLDDMWLLSEGHCFRDQVRDLCARAAGTGRGQPIRFESGNLETLRMMVDRAGGVTLLPTLATLPMSEAGRHRIRSFAEPVPQREVRVVYGRAYLKRALIEAYVDVVTETIEPLLRPTSR
jgi:LysR family hydrogen peroxide-inducible transcriptional activator